MRFTTAGRQERTPVAWGDSSPAMAVVRDMRRRFVFGILVAVAVAHWLVIWGPWEHRDRLFAVETHVPDHLDTVWVQMPEPVVQPRAPSAPAKPAPQPAKQAKKSILPPSVLPIAEMSPPEPLVSDEQVTVVESEVSKGVLSQGVPAVDDEVGSAVAAAPSAPRLQVHDAAGTPLMLALPSADAAASQHALLQFKVHGFVKGMEYHANAEMAWHVEGVHYHARQSISAFLLGSMEQTSQGLWGVQGLQPLEFTDRRFAKQRSVQFDWERGQAVFTPDRPAAAIGQGAQDRLSVFLQLAAMLQAMPQLRVAGTRIEIPTLGSRSLQMWVFVVEESEDIEVPAGRIPTLRLRRVSQAGDEEQALLWVHPEQGYMPVRIHLQERDGDVMDFVLKP